MNRPLKISFETNRKVNRLNTTNDSFRTLSIRMSRLILH
ncbi:hypothetical protein ZOD2009_08863 [Haladaptatus paucihalophilus DX253]|uniref:Uncharacterized protein n=1 Tax=Haladaptatus paucihalophilus DX253 TaxID=797209 RepID=E7QSJ7_HALPU|nr:hypothetical protein ZOD2009_08863 [Haladaptatus paucihalophilus DX253]